MHFKHHDNEQITFSCIYMMTKLNDINIPINKRI